MTMNKKIVLATNNSGKVQEFAEMWADTQIEILPQSVFNVPNVAETGLSFVENAIIKARHTSSLTGLPSIADDSGLEVDMLNGEPGIYSARYAGESADFKANIDKLLQALIHVPKEKRTARFQCILVYMQHAHDATPLICQGIWEGQILMQPRGTQGFGYDPIFYVPTHQCSAAQLPPEVKNKISHRGQALAVLERLIAIDTH